MKIFLKIMVIFFIFPILNTNILAIEIIDKNSKNIDKIKVESKKIFKNLTGKSLKKKDILEFLSEYVIIFDDKKGDGLTTYYFENLIYKRYKNFDLISEDRWEISKFSEKLKIYDGEIKNTWKIRLGDKNMINIKKKLNSFGKSYEFSYQNKTDYHINLEEIKLNKLKK